MKRPKILLGLLLTLALVVSLITALPALASDIHGTKITTDVPDKYYVGDIIDYEMTVENPPSNIYTNNLTNVYDTWPDGSTYFFIEDGVDLPLIQDPGDSITYSLNYTIDEADIIILPSGPNAGRYGVLNYFDAHGWDSHGDPVDVHTGRNSVVLRPAINIRKTVDFNGDGVYGELETNEPGQTASWKIVVCNSGYDPVYNITVTDTNGHNFGTPFDLLNTGDCQTFTYNMIIAVDTVNTATAEGEDELGNPVGPVHDPAEVRVTTFEVGGTAFPVDKLKLLAPWALLLGCAGVVALLMLRRRRQA